MPRTIPTALATHPPTPEWKDAGDKATHSAALQSGPRDPMRFSDIGDLASRLPPRAAVKLRALRQEWEELNTLTQSDIELQQELFLEGAKAQSRYDQLTNASASLRNGGDGSVLTPDHPSVVQARSELDRLNDKKETLRARQEARKPRRDAIGNLVRRIEDYLRTPGVDIAPFDMEPIELPPGERPADAVQRMRQKRRELIVDLKTIEAAPVSSSVVKRKLRAQIEDLAEKGRPDCYRLIEGGSSVRFAERQETLSVAGFVVTEGAPFISARASGALPDAIALIAFMFQDQLISVLEAEVDESADDENALNDDQRSSRSAEILQELLAVERLEEAFTEMAGSAVVRRADLDPRAFLSVTGPEPKGDFS